ncbi:MAG: carbohydrate esterase [Cytophagales bacterium CG12_big_fil_rev_8_21_14_0_65_40_12]|nr:MAG: carbohydrate esterase [Cytophagales bacterium CG12_big_fil_rev_8_21_14_0_65_40_12]PIW06280.1 MAG: carbohydrate esterase [Cytophagales bacterium CG17_big_fil_post_rev_8_21_14_2_50_40_13]
METFKPIIEILEEAFEIPHLQVKRRVSALLPYDYHRSEKLYPVLYLQDGQNLFNPDAPYGNWAIDQSLAQLANDGFHEIIIIAIDHGDDERIVEYSPYYNPRLGTGKGKAYVDFLVDSLIPYVEGKLRVSPDPKNRGIGGSSMGGLISLYAGVTRPDVFAKMMIFSPSLWVSPMIYHDAAKYQVEHENALYLYAGAKESRFHLPNIHRLSKIIEPIFQSSENGRFISSINEEGNHGEFYWGIEFPKAIKWLYFNN